MPAAPLPTRKGGRAAGAGRGKRRAIGLDHGDPVARRNCESTPPSPPPRSDQTCTQIVWALQDHCCCPSCASCSSDPLLSLATSAFYTTLDMLQGWSAYGCMVPVAGAGRGSACWRVGFTDSAHSGLRLPQPRFASAGNGLGVDAARGLNIHPKAHDRPSMVKYVSARPRP